MKHIIITKVLGGGGITVGDYVEKEVSKNKEMKEGSMLRKRC